MVLAVGVLVSCGGTPYGQIVDIATSVEGTVRDAASSEPLAGVEVSNSFSTTGADFRAFTITGSDGRYEEHALGLPSARYRFRKEGYETLVLPGSAARQLSPGHYQLDASLVAEGP